MTVGACCVQTGDINDNQAEPFITTHHGPESDTTDRTNTESNLLPAISSLVAGVWGGQSQHKY